MVASFVAGAVLAVAGVAYLGYKFHSAKAVLAAVKAEAAKLESEYGVAVSAEVAKVVARIKALL